MATLDRIADQFRRDLLRGERQAAARMARAYRDALVPLDQSLDAITARIAEARRAGQPLGVSWLFQQERLASLKRQALAELSVFARFASVETEGRQAQAVGMASDQARALTVAALGPGPPRAIAAIEVSFMRLSTAALEEFVGRLWDGSPLRRLFDALPQLVSQKLEQALIAGLATGQGPREIARAIRGAQGLGLSRALLISRTEVLRAHREATRRIYQANEDIIDGWIWHAKLDRRTCPACIAMHGSFHELDARLDGHPGCRCAQVPHTRSWRELGVDAPETRPEVELGEEWFKRQGADTQRAILGPAGFDAFRRGEVSLISFVGRKSRKDWGTMRFARSLKAIREGRGGRWVGRAAVPGPPAP